MSDWNEAALGGEATGIRPMLGWIAIGGIAYFAAAILLLHGLRPDVSPIARVTSEYAVGRYGFLMTSAYFVFGMALLALGAGLRRSLSSATTTTAGIAALFLAAVATATAGLFPVDVGAARPVTTTGWTHRIAAIVAFASMTAGPLLLARQFRLDPRWRDLAWIGAVTGVVGLLGLASIQLFLLERGLAGAAQRVVLALVVLWMLASAFRLTAARRPGNATDGRRN